MNLPDTSEKKLSIGDVWGGFAAMLVALPAAIGFGVAVYGPLGGGLASQGATAGILGVIGVGIVAAVAGSTRRLISAPCAPAAAVLSGVTILFSQQSIPADNALRLVLLVVLLSALIQIAFGLLRVGSLIKYMPFPVVSGYLSGVGIYMMISQMPKVLGLPSGQKLWAGILSPALWTWQNMAIGAATALTMIIAPKLTRRIPGVILALASGLLCYAVLALADPALRTLQNNRFVVGPIANVTAESITASVAIPIEALMALTAADLGIVLVPALTLAILLSIDTLKTCLILDTMTKSSHDSNRELLGQGLGNLAAGLLGAIPGAGTMGATLVNLNSGAQTRFSGVLQGLFALTAFLLFSSYLAWIPIASLAAILVMIGFRMIDQASFRLAKSRSTILDFLVIVTVVIVANAVSLIMATAVGILLTVLLFLREQIKAQCVVRKTSIGQQFSKRMRQPKVVEFLMREGGQGRVIELQGSLFFGNASLLKKELMAEAAHCRYLILDMRRVKSIDLTAVQMLARIQELLKDKAGRLLLSGLPDEPPGTPCLRSYLTEMGIVRTEEPGTVFDQLTDAIEWVEEALITKGLPPEHVSGSLALESFEIFSGHQADTLQELRQLLKEKTLGQDQLVFQAGDTSDEIYFITQGEVRIEIVGAGAHPYHVATLGPGEFFGEMAFLDTEPRSARARANSAAVRLLSLSRREFNEFVETRHRRLGMTVTLTLAKQLAKRLRTGNREIQGLRDG